MIMGGFANYFCLVSPYVEDSHISSVHFLGILTSFIFLSKVNTALLPLLPASIVSVELCRFSTDIFLTTSVIFTLSLS